MIDDARKNVDGARQAGLNGILFTNAIALATQLRLLRLAGSPRDATSLPKSRRRFG